MLTNNTISTNVRQLAKKFQFGAIAYKLYYSPKTFVQRTLQKGVLNVVTDHWSSLQMEAAAYNLPSINIKSSQEPLDIYFLTGRNFWYQTCLCAYSMAQHTNLTLRPIIYDDGSLEKKYQDQIIKIFPNAKIILNSEIEEYINQYLPQKKFPYLRERRLNYPNLRKVTDIHIASQGWKLVLDSDMLFFRTPDFLLDWLKSPQQPCHMVDVETSYGYPETLMASLAQANISERLNVGICGLKSEDIDWEKLEYWCRTMIEQQGTHYYQEQALVAMLMAGKPCAVAPDKEYIVMPSKDEVIQPQAVLHHYVADSKPWYFRYGWKHIVK
ncbi:glycosyl transferase [Nostoc sp. FACHB-87]|uniref:glycosyl transferase n=1 Tax=Nostocales TaxID=1161 RepID=UPI001682B7EE|nr:MULTISPECIES: glycosyl transferase [Nostocales]MBD2452903.1 glycosyl transferase [Nostoc sp. FACHB-87]MBD2473834.1 glycosyl transferase [Anabaena sp. FACHB-83]MBD2491111.1 glycosyl transferase [Aulosira sp. FACHB-615]